MAGVKISLTLDQSPITDMLNKLESLPNNMNVMLNEIGSMLVDSTQSRFRSNIAPDGTTWKPSQRAKKESGNTLLDHGNLRDSITFFADDRGVDVGSNVIYAAIHQLGGDINVAARSQQAYFRQNKRTGEIGNRFVKKSKSNFAQWVTLPSYKINMPARPFLGTSNDDEDEIIDIIRKFIIAESGIEQ